MTTVDFQWTERELELIRTTLAIKPLVDAEHSVKAYRTKASRIQTAIARQRRMLAPNDSVQHQPRYKPDPDDHTVALIRQSHSNVRAFQHEQESRVSAALVSKIGHLKISKQMQSAFPALKDAIVRDTRKRVSSIDRILLRQAVLRLADETKIDIPVIPYSELWLSTVENYNKRLQPQHASQAMDASSPDEKMRKRIREEIVVRIGAQHLYPLVTQLGVDIVDSYTDAVVRERIYCNGLSVISYHYPDLAERCQRHMKMYRGLTIKRMNLKLTSDETEIYADAFWKVCKRVCETYNERYRNDIQNGTKLKLWFVGTETLPATMSALAVRDILSRSSRYDEFMDVAESLPEPMAAFQKEKIRRLFLNRVQEHYPELSETVEAELALLTPETEAAIAS